MYQDFGQLFFSSHLLEYVVILITVSSYYFTILLVYFLTISLLCYGFGMVMVMVSFSAAILACAKAG